jgi:CheY-like chemotaxis protein
VREFLKSAKGAARTAKLLRNRFAPCSVLRELFRSAKGAARTAKLVRNRFAPRSVLRELFRSAKGAARTAKLLRNRFAPRSVLRELFRRGNDMTNQTILSLLDYLCNEARNSVQASFGLMALSPNLAPNPLWQSCVENSKCGADRLLRCIDDIRELLSTEPPAFEPAEEFDITLSLGETIELLNMASGDRASRLFLQSAAPPVVGRQHRRAMEQALMRVLDAVSKIGRKGEALVAAVRADDGEGVRFEIIPANSNIALRVADWLNSDADQVNFEDSDEVLYGVATLVAGKRIRALGGTAEFVSDARAPMALVISLPWRALTTEEAPSQPSDRDQPSLSVLVAEDSDESFVLTGILLQKELVWRAHDGLQALHMMKTHRFDVVLMDIHMPGLDGYKTIRSMRDWETQTGNARTPIVVLSSDDLDTQMRSASASGCSGFLRKPLDRQDLFDLLDRVKTARTVSV